MILKRAGAIFDDNQLAIIADIEPFSVGMDLEATRGHSKPDEQLATIAKYAKIAKIKFPEFMPGNPVDIKRDVPGFGLLYHWQRTWWTLLLNDFVINPPLDAVCKVGYIRSTGENMMDKIIKATSHITGENGSWPIDFSQKVNGFPNIKLVTDIMTRAMKSGVKISYIKPEPKNCCVHIGTLMKAAV